MASVPDGTLVVAHPNDPVLAHVSLPHRLWYPGSIIEVPIDDLLDESLCTLWLE